MEGRLTGFSLTPDGGAQNITVTVAADFRQTYDELKEDPVEIQIKKARKHRSLEANAYAWVLIDKIAEKLHLKKTEVYRKAVLDIGGVSETVLVPAENAHRMKAWWEAKGTGWQAVELASDEEGWTYLTCYVGSSEYDTEQMSGLIDSLIQDAEALGIPTITPKEELEMLRKWGKKAEGKRNATDENGTDHAGTCGALPQEERGQLPQDQQGEGCTLRTGDESREMAAQR